MSNDNPNNPASAIRRKIRAANKRAAKEGRLQTRQYQLWLSEMEQQLETLIAYSESRDETLFDGVHRVY